MSKERKGFNFYRSYFDVYKELSTKEDKILFIDALLDRQFYGVEPNKLKGMSKFAYISQKYNIDAQVKGWEDKTGLSLCTPTEGGSITPTEQEKGEGQEKEKEKEKEEYTFELFFNHFHKVTNTKKVNKEPSFKHWKKLKLEEQRKAYKMVLPYFNSIEEKKFLVIARTYLSSKRFNDEFKEVQMQKFDLMNKDIKPTFMKKPNFNFTHGWFDLG